nr:immunity 53 family protein [uncultured Flavobacterium sp.]
MDTTLLSRLQNWYLTNCDGDWEHSYGISIGTLDNPGWIVKIDLADTCLQDLDYKKEICNGDFDWLDLRVNEKTFIAAGDPSKLTALIHVFLNEIIPNYVDQTFEYEVYVLLIGGPTKIWRPAKAKMVSEDTLQIVSLPDLDYTTIRARSESDMNFKKEQILKFHSNVSVGDNIKVELIDTSMGTTLIAIE